MIPIVCFTSDFGLDDAWVGVCHATIHRTCPQAHVVDLAHSIAPYDIRKGAVVTSSGVWQLPKAVHLVAVDPGVGGGRQDVCVVTGTGTRLVGPDNGVLTLAARRAGGIAEAYAIDPSVLRPRPPLPTFHARDVLAPAAATLASGVGPESLGTSIDPETLEAAPFAETTVANGICSAEVLDIDRFGSVRLAVSTDDLEDLGDAPTVLELDIGHSTLEVPFGTTFSDVEHGDLVALIDSSGWLTLAVREGDAAERFGIEPGVAATVRIRG